MRSTSQISCSVAFLQMPPNMCQLPVRCCTDPSGAAYSNVQVLFEWGTRSRISSLNSNTSACGTWWRWRLIATMLYAVYSYGWKTYATGFMLYYWCYCNDYLFYTMVPSTDPGNGTVTQEFCLLIRQGATPFDGKTLTGWTLFHETYCKPPPSSSWDREGLEALLGTLPERGIITVGLLHHHASLRSDAWVVYLGLRVHSSSYMVVFSSMCFMFRSCELPIMIKITIM
jgi:hypothetical protein